MLAILRPPTSMRSAHDILGSETAYGLTQNGLKTEVLDLWPESWAWLWHSRIPGRRRLFEAGPVRWHLHRLAATLESYDAFWIMGTSSLRHPTLPLERKLKTSGKPIIFHLLDDWFSVPWLEVGTHAAVKLADVVVTPTDALRERALGLYPEMPVLRLEEPIEVDRFLESNARASKEAVVVWCGNPNNLKEIPYLLSVLVETHAAHPFTMRVICGEKKPTLDLGLPWEWYPYRREEESELMAGASVGLSPVEDTPYARCKGSYKVKTYMASGVPVVASPIGHQKDMVENGVNGFLASSKAEWKEALRKLLGDPALAESFGAAGRAKALSQYAHSVLMPQWSRALQGALGYDS